MRGLRVHWMASLLSFCGAFLGAAIMNDSLWEPKSGNHVIWVGLVFAVIFLFAYVGMYVGLRFLGKYRGVMPKGWLMWAGIALGGLLLIGILGQLLFPQKKAEIIYHSDPKPADLVMLVDCSGSMSGDRLEGAKDASCQLVDILTDDINLQVLAFGDIVVDGTAFVPMDAAGRAEAKTFIQNIDCTGGTNFDDALSMAKQTLDGSSRRNSCNQVVMLVTDGEATISSNVQSDYQSSNIQLHSVRITDGLSYGGYTKDLLQLVSATGGRDVEISTTWSGSVDATELLNGFQMALQNIIGEVGEEPGKETLITTGEPEDVFLLRMVIVAACYLLATMGFYGLPSPKGWIFRSVWGLAIGALTLFAQDYVDFMVIYLLTVGPAWVIVRPLAEEVMDV